MMLQNVTYPGPYCPLGVLDGTFIPGEERLDRSVSIDMVHELHMKTLKHENKLCLVVNQEIHTRSTLNLSPKPKSSERGQ